MDGIKSLKESLRKAEAELRRARQAYSVCLINSDATGCAAEQQAVARAEREVGALLRRINEAEQQAADKCEAETTSTAYGLLYE